MIGYKLLHKRSDGSLGPLFINRKLRVSIGEWLKAESHPTKGFAVRPGWHITNSPEAPHLSMKNRVWCEVEFEDYYDFKRPASQGGIWYIANWMKVIRELEELDS